MKNFVYYAILSKSLFTLRGYRMGWIDIKYPYKNISDKEAIYIAQNYEMSTMEITNELSSKMYSLFNKNDLITHIANGKGRGSHRFYTVSYSFKAYSDRCYVDNVGALGKYKSSKSSRIAKESENPNFFKKDKLSKLFNYIWKYHKKEILNINYFDGEGEYW